ncbi:MAG: thioesterase family protein [Rhodobacteraceae bacterium]|nr:thioesterase family protein [Paracoccaceae bacterium]
MYPYLRMAYQLAKHHNDDDLPLNGTHISQHICWPIDIDPWRELNNGRTLTLYDLGRIAYIKRIPLAKVLRENHWGMTMAGAAVRYRRRIRMFDRFEMRTKAIGRDARFIYIQQSMWRNDEAASSGLFRAAVVGKSGIIPTNTVCEKMQIPDWNPTMPDWVLEWIAAEAIRTWPPEV